MTATQKLVALAEAFNRHRIEVRNTVGSLAAGARLAREMTEATGEPCPSINDAIDWRAKALAIEELRSKGFDI